MTLKKRNNCPVCNSKNINIFKRGTINLEKINTDDFKITDNKYGSLWTFFLCRNCDFVFSNPYITEDKIVKFYSNIVDQEYSTEAIGRAKNFKTILKRLKRIKKPGNTLLDIGAASGIFLNLAQKQGYKTWGIEPSEFLVKEAKRLYGIKLFKGTVDDFKQDQKFSIITLLDIIEHLVEPDKFMSKIDQLIDRNGIIIIVTPDISSLAPKISGNHWWHFRTAHINFFNLRSIHYLLKKHNFEIVKKKRFAWNFSLFYLSTRIFPSLKGKKTLQKALKSINLKLNFFDSWEIYAKKS